MEVRRARTSDSDGINRLLRQVLDVHHSVRPDLFKGDAKKYTDSELYDIIKDDKRPIFVAADGDGKILGYAFCVFVRHENDNILADIKTLYIDDLCVDENCRGEHIGSALYNYVLDFAKREGCYNVTLNVWADNTGARRFYEKCGLREQKIGMEKIL